MHGREMTNPPKRTLKTKFKSSPRDKELMRSSVLHSKGFLSPLLAFEELRQARFYIDTMEAFIESSESAEVTALEAQTLSMSADEKEEFWQWNAPIHWQEVFGMRIRSSFCTQLCSQVEATLATVSQNVQIIERCPVTVKNIKAQNELGRHRLYLDAFGKFKGPSEAAWREVTFMFQMRNVNVHEQGFFGNVNDFKAFKEFLDGLPNVKTSSNFIELKSDSCPALLQISERFHAELFSEYEAYRNRIIELET